MNTTAPHVTAIILNFDRREDTLECLRSIMKNDYPALSVLLLDYHSPEDTIKEFESVLPSVEVIHLTQNKGYAGNNNVGIQLAVERQSDWMLILNEDTFLDPKCISELVKCGQMDPAIGIVGPLVYHYDEPEVIQTAGAEMDPHWLSRHRSMNEKDMGQYKRVEEVDWVSGCAFLIRKDAVAEGGFDERFFYYNEETELCYRTRKKGWKIFFTPAARLWHKGVKRDYKPAPNISYYYTRNQLLFLRKHSAPLSVRLYNWFYFIRTVLSWTIKPQWTDKREHRDAMLQGMLDYLRGRWGMRQRL